MANRLYNQFGLALEKSVVILYGQFTIGAAGAPTNVPLKSKGIASVTRLSAGRYQIVLQDTYVGLLMFSATIQSTATPAAPCYRVVSHAVSNVASKNIIVQFSLADGTATDPGNGERILFAVDLQNSTAF